MQKIKEGQRLAFYSSLADRGFWDRHWRSKIIMPSYQLAREGRLGWFEGPFTRYLPASGKVLEAGCGMGQYVLALRTRGYDAEGVEWSRETVTRVKKLFPALPIRIGDVTHLRVKNGTYHGYISLGVIEHRHQGPDPYLREAWRILAPGGIAMFSVPHFNLLRRWKASLGWYRGQAGNEQFYQYAFPERDLDALVKKYGFHIVGHYRYDGFKGLKEEIPLFRDLSRRLIMPRVPLTPTIKNAVSHRKTNRVEGRPLVLQCLDQIFGHMTMIIGQKSISGRLPRHTKTPVDS